MSTQLLLLTDLHIFDGHASNLTGAQDILIEAGRIREIGANLRAEGARVLKGAGRFAIPGLIDAHFHANAPLLDIEMADRMPLASWPSMPGSACKAPCSVVSPPCATLAVRIGGSPWR